MTDEDLCERLRTIARASSDGWGVLARAAARLIEAKNDQISQLRYELMITREELDCRIASEQGKS